MDRTERFYKIDRLLRGRRLVSLRAFLDELEISRATFKRDLEYLRDRFNAPIVWDAEAGGYRYDGEVSAPLPGFWLSPAELHALLSIEHLLESLEPGLLSASLAPLKARLEQALVESPKKLRELRTRVKLLQMARRPVAAPHFSAIASALLQRKQLQITYASRERGDKTERAVSPQRLVYYRDNWYLDAWCHWRKGLRSFSLDAIESLTPLDEPGKEIPRRNSIVFSPAATAFSAARPGTRPRCASRPGARAGSRVKLGIPSRKDNLMSRVATCSSYPTAIRASC